MEADKITLDIIEKQLIRNSTTLDDTWELESVYRDLRIPYISLDEIDIDTMDIKCYWYNKIWVNMTDYGIIDYIGVRVYFYNDKLCAVSYKYEDYEKFFWVEDMLDDVVNYLRSLVKPDYNYISKINKNWRIQLFYSVDDGKELCTEMVPNPIKNAYYEGRPVEIGFLEVDESQKSSIPNAVITTESGKTLTVPVKDLEFRSNLTSKETW